jgi:L-rhamnose isomerase
MGNINETSISQAYSLAKGRYAALGVDTESALADIAKLPISLHCWQGDDVRGFETDAGGASGGILSTGSYPGAARSGDELRADYEKALSLIPGKHRVNLHAIYAETDGVSVPRDQLKTEHFRKWIDWAKKLGVGVDFNPSCFGHPMAASGFTISSPDENVRQFWIRHVEICRAISADIGKEIGSPCVMNIWFPDGMKDQPADRLGFRQRMKDALDVVFATKYDRRHLIDALESKLFGIGVESYTVASHEFVMGYGLKNNLTVCFDMGHFHLTESVADKISATLLFTDDLLLHVSRPVRWDSDHVVILNDDLLALAQEVKRSGAFGRIYFALDFFDGSINRIMAWVTGTRAAQKALLIAMLEPTHLLRDAEASGDYGRRLALLEECKSLPFSAVWDMFCLQAGVPVGTDWVDEAGSYERDVLAKRA